MVAWTTTHGSCPPSGRSPRRPTTIFELIADPAQQPRWDGNDNLAEAPAGQRVRAVGDVFTMTNTSGRVRDNRIVEFEEGRRIAWLPSPQASRPPVTSGAGSSSRWTTVTPR